MEAVYLSLVGKFSGVAILRTLGVNTLRRHFLVSFSNVAILAARSRCRGVGFIFPHSFSLHLTGPPHMGRCLHMGRRASAETFLNIFPDRPKVFLRCGDDCFCIIKKKKKDSTSIRLNQQFSSPWKERQIQFLLVLMKRQANQFSLKVVNLPIPKLPTI